MSQLALNIIKNLPEEIVNVIVERMNYSNKSRFHLTVTGINRIVL